MQGRRGTVAALGALAAMLVLAGPAIAADSFQVSRVKVTPAGTGTAARPLPVSVGFGLRVRADDPSKRPGSIKTYVIGTEGVVAFPKPFPACSFGKVKLRRGPPRACRSAQIGRGLIRAAAGLEDDDTIAQSLPCNLELRFYNTGAGLALRLDANPPYPHSFNSPHLGCPVPVHTAIRGSFKPARIDGVRSMDLTFTLPPLLLHPLEDWEGALQLVNATLGGRTARPDGAGHRVGFFSVVGCHGGQRTSRAAFIDAQGTRTEATRSIAC